jgi:pimeloyl-ACP methyl ester carboxylesterase
MTALLGKIAQFKWVPTGETELASAESAILSNIPGGYHRYVVSTPQCEINTISSVPRRSERAALPARDIVLFLHGFGFGCVQWVPNWDEIAKVADVYAFDMPGFGRSGRPNLHSSYSREEALIFLIQSVEEWIKSALSTGSADRSGEAAIPRIIIVGHSFGGYVAGKFAVNYPHRIKKIVLLDPFGLDHPPKETIASFFDDKSRAERAKIWAAKKIFYSIGTPTFLRALGPLGADIFHGKKGANLSKQWSRVIGNPEAVADYVYHSNVRGESGWFLLSRLVHGIGAGIGEGFHILMPLKDDLVQRLPPDISLHFILGSHSWIPSEPALITAAERKAKFGAESSVEILPSAGHHVYLDRHHQVNELIVEWITGGTGD